MKDIFFAFGFMILIMALGISYISAFKINYEIPLPILKTFNQSHQQIEQSIQKIEEQRAKVAESQGLIDTFFNSLSLAFGLIQFIALNLFTIVLSIPEMFVDSMNFLSKTFGLDPFATGIIISLVVGYAVIKAIQFLLNREL